jgi:hypothetical protein
MNYMALALPEYYLISHLGLCSKFITQPQTIYPTKLIQFAEYRHTEITEHEK